MKCVMMLLCLMLCLAGCAPSSKDQAVELFNKANGMYKAGDFVQAIATYEMIAAKGWMSGPVYFNLGNSYLKTGNLGKAVLNYTRAQRLIPRDSDLQSNLAFALSRQLQPEPGQETLGSRLLLAVSANEAAGGMVGVGVMLTLMVILGIVFNWPLNRRVIVFTILGFALSLQVFAFAAKMDSEHSTAVIMAQSEVRYEPESSAAVHYTVHEGWTVRVLKSSQGWIKIQRRDGLMGWIEENKLKTI